MDEKDYKAMNEESKPQLKQTAVQWLIEQILELPLEASTNTAHLKKYVNKITEFEKALEMEKEQMFDYIKNLYCNGDASLKFHSEEFEQYYNKTYEQ